MKLAIVEMLEHAPRDKQTQNEGCADDNDLGSDNGSTRVAG